MLWRGNNIGKKYKELFVLLDDYFTIRRKLVNIYLFYKNLPSNL